MILDNTSENVNRIARAICNVAGYPHGAVEWSATDESIRNWYRKLAVAVIEELNDPAE